MKRPKDKCIACGRTRVCLLIESSLASPDDEIYDDVQERVLICRRCLREDNGTLALFLLGHTIETERKR